MVRQNAFAITLASFGVLLGIGLSAWSLHLGVGFAAQQGWEGYIEKINWSLFPLFFVLVGTFCVFSWYLYELGLKGIGSGPESIIYVADQQVVGSAIVDALLQRLSMWRRYFCWLSLALGLSLTAIDYDCLWGEYELISEVDACGTREKDFTIAFRHPDAFGSASISYEANLAFNFGAYLMQGLLIAISFQALFHLCLSTFCLLYFERSKVARQYNAKIVLNHRDRHGEFGLSPINDAINLNYIFIAVCMVVPVVSAYKNPNPPYDVGQLLLRVLVPLILLLPALFPIIERWNRVRAVRSRVREMNSDDASSYKEQKLWPFDQRFFGSFGKVAAVVCISQYGYVVKTGLEMIIDVFKDAF